MKIVILGGGFGGITAAKHLSTLLRQNKAEHEILLIDKNEYHTYTPTLYEIATASIQTAGVAKLKQIVTFPFAEIFKQYNITTQKGEIIAINTEHHTVTLANNENISWDYLIIALGAEPAYFGIPGLKKNSLQMKWFPDAIRIRDTIVDLLEKNPVATIAVGGGGTTGVELAGEIQMWIRSKEMKKQIPEAHRARVVIIEKGTCVLRSFSRRVQEAAMRRLRRLGVGIVTNEQIASVQRNELTFTSGQKLPFSLFIWTGGITTPHILKPLTTKKEQKVCLQTTNEMRLIQQDGSAYDRIFAIGDNAHCINEKTDEPVPAVARAAIEQACVAAAHIANHIARTEGVPITKPAATYQPPQSYAAVIPIGGKYAIAVLGSITVTGRAAWILKGFVELRYLFSILPPFRAVCLWLKGLWIFIQNDRLG